MTAAEVRRVRVRLRLTQAQLAAKLGVHEMTVSRWERGTGQVPAPVARLIRFVAASAPKRRREGENGTR